MTKFLMAGIGLTAIALAWSSPAYAQDDRTGSFQVKAFLTGVLPDGEIDTVVTDAVGLPAGSQTEVTDQVVPTIAASYFFSDSFSVETICCVTPHDVRGTGGLDGAELIDDAVVLPATVTFKFHPDMGTSFRPYIGAGPAYFFIFGEDVGADAAALGVTDVNLTDELGFALQAGVDIPLNDSGWGLSIDAKRYFIDTTAEFIAGNAVAIETDHTLDPWVIGAGLSYTF
ncbi:MAG: OmpW family outer membrane protein [Litorimonas sp.]